MSVDLKKAAPLQAFMLVIFSVIVLRDAWLGDDSYIAFRVVDNFVNGYGLRWNILERVQAFTSPLWVFVMSVPYFFTREAYYTAIVLALVFDIAAIWILLYRNAAGFNSALIVFLLIISSNAFIDYATSGLENPLLYFLLALFCWQLRTHWDSRSGLRKMVLIAALIGLTRLDNIPIILPPCAMLFFRNKEYRIRNAFIGLLPLIIWEIFSLIYFGTPFPNTFYAKVPSNISSSALHTQGLVYYLDSITHDPFTLSTIALGLVLAVTVGDSLKRTLAIGIVLQLLYVISVGGDFMGGRFFTSAFVVACSIIGSVDLSRHGKYILPVLFFWVTCFVQFHTLPINTRTQINPGESILTTGIANERAFYVNWNGILNMRRDFRMPAYGWRYEGARARMKGDKIVPFRWVGMFGFYAGPDVHVVDLYALADPFLSRLPTLPVEDWRIGHFERAVPSEYISSLENGRNEFVDQDLAQLFDETLMITRGPLFSATRWRIILRRLLPQKPLAASKLTVRQVVPYQHVMHEAQLNVAWNAPGNIIIPINGLEISLPHRTTATKLDFSVDCNDDYEIGLQMKRVPIYSTTINADSSRCPGVIERSVIIPQPIAERGYDSITINGIPVTDHLYSLGFLAIRHAAPPSAETIRSGAP